MAVPRIEVVAAVLADAAGAVLLDRRPAGRPHAGWWEFPGGKLEPGEAPWHGLVRELSEELGIEVLAGVPLLQLTHRYPEREIVLHVWRVSAWRGDLVAHDGQALQWFQPAALLTLKLLPADRPIGAWLRAPDHLLITPDPGVDRDAFLAQLEQRCSAGVRMVVLRAPSLSAAEYAALACRARTATRGAALILHFDPLLAADLDCDGLHLDSRRLMTATSRPVPLDRWCSASVHDAAEVIRARELGVDLLLAGPVLATPSHPGATTLGWDGLAELLNGAGLPAYALGGLAIGDLARAQQAGARGVAGIRSFWRG